MATERKSPDAILEISNLTGTVAEIQDDPDAPDTNWLDQSGGNNVDTFVRVSFPTPTGSPTVGADLQEFRAQVRKYGGTGTPTARIELYENGTLIRAGTETNVNSYNSVLISFTWNANEIATADGSLVECRVYGTKSGGGPSARAAVEIGAVEWNVTYSTGTTHLGTATLSGVGALAGIGALIFNGLAALAGSGTLASIGRITYAGKAILSGVGSITAVGRRILTGVASLTGYGAVACIGTIGGVIQYGVATLTGIGSLATNAVLNLTGKATLAGVGTLASIGSKIITGIATISGAGLLSAVGGVYKVGVATLSGVGNLTAKGIGIFSGKLTLNGAGSLVARGVMTWVGKAVIAGSGLLSAIGNLVSVVIGEERYRETFQLRKFIFVVPMKHISDSVPVKLYEFSLTVSLKGEAQ